MLSQNCNQLVQSVKDSTIKRGWVRTPIVNWPELIYVFFFFQTVHLKVNDLSMHCKGRGDRPMSPYLQPGMKYGRGPPPQMPMGHLVRYDLEGQPPPALMKTPPMPPQPPPPPAPPVPSNSESEGKDLNKLFGMTASDIDKYSRIFFPVTFTCFQLMYWIIYSHLSDDVVADLVFLNP